MKKNLLILNAAVFAVPMFAVLSSVHAEDLPAKLKEVAEFVSKKEACQLAVAEIPTRIANSDVYMWKNQLLCVQDLTSGQGTMNEASGCAFTHYSADTGRYSAVQTMDSFGRANVEIVKGKSCAKGGFEELLKRKLGVYGAATVLNKLTHPVGPGGKMAVVVSAKSEYKSTIEKEIKAAEVARKK